MFLEEIYIDADDVKEDRAAEFPIISLGRSIFFFLYFVGCVLLCRVPVALGVVADICSMLSFGSETP